MPIDPGRFGKNPAVEFGSVGPSGSSITPHEYGGLSSGISVKLASDRVIGKWRSLLGERVQFPI